MSAMAEPIAYFLTFTTYGTWLHGDERGSVDDRHNLFGLPRAVPDPSRHQRTSHKLKWPPFTLDARSRGIVELTIEQVSMHRKWNLVAANVRTNHVHIVVVAGHSADRTLADCKAWCTRRLREAGSLDPPERQVWTEGGSTRMVFDAQGLAAVVHYTKFGQGPDLPKEL